MNSGRGRTPPLRIFERFYNGRTGASAPTDNKKCCESGRRGNRRSAASGGKSELISRKCPDWRPQQWPGIGWHDGGQPPPPTGGARGAVGRATARVAPTDVLQGARWGGPMPTSAPTHHLAIEFRRGGALPRPRATARVAPTENMRYGGGGTHGSRPTPHFL